MKTVKTFEVIFFTRKSKGKAGMLSIYARITVNGELPESMFEDVITQILRIKRKQPREFDI